MRLIDAGQIVYSWFVKEDGTMSDGITLQSIINRLPTIDAVPVIRCKDCKYLSMTTIGMPYACWHGAEGIWGETGEHQSHHVCTRIDDIEHYCGYAVREGNDDND